MKAIIIKGFEMPSCCEKCRLLDVHTLVCLPLKVYIDHIYDREERLIDCPLEEVEIDG